MTGSTENSCVRERVAREIKAATPGDCATIPSPVPVTEFRCRPTELKGPVPFRLPSPVWARLLFAHLGMFSAGFLSQAQRIAGAKVLWPRTFSSARLPLHNRSLTNGLDEPQSLPAPREPAYQHDSPGETYS